MNKRYFFLFALFPFFQVSASTYPEVLFDNSLMPKSYYYSESSFEGTSWINHMNGHLPVSDSIFFTPGNALLLHYVSGNGGSWRTKIYYNNDDGYLAKDNDVLVFKLFSVSGTTKENLPIVVLTQGENNSEEINMQRYVSNFQDNTWISVAIPLKDIGNLDKQAPINSLVFKQGASDGKEHTVFIDQIEFMPAKTPDMKLTGKAVLSSVDAYERHVDISWQLPLTPSIRYIKIYRSTDKENFSPVGIRPISTNRFTDIVPNTDVSYYYKIAWVDYHYRESPFSDIKKADTKLATDEELLNMIERSHIAYFNDETEFNSGMHKISSSVSDARVSVKATGVGLLAQTVGAERAFIPRQLLLDRVEKVLKFLSKATNYHGAFPELLDGRTGNPVSTDSCEISANVESTAYLMQGLLVARNYFNKDEPAEKEVREKITSLWEAVDWQAFVKGDRGHHLYSRWSPACAFDKAVPLGGYNSSFIAYLLAIVSPTHPIAPDSYQLGFKQPLKYEGPAIGRFSISLNDTLLTDTANGKHLLYSKKSVMIDSTYYGIHLVAGHPSTSLIYLQQLFLAFNPRTAIDEKINFYDNQKNLSNVFYRAALNRSEQFVSLSNLLWPYVGDDSSAINRFNPAAAIATYPFTPIIAMEALKNYYRNLSPYLWTAYGFRDEFNFKDNWVSGEFDPIHQASVPVMLENARTGLIWDLFMKDADIQKIEQLLK